MADINRDFGGEKGFCWNCGCILPMLEESGSVKCFMCKFEYGPEAFGAMDNHYEINFNSPTEYLNNIKANASGKSNISAGPVVDRKCPRCGNEAMSYATLQLRSADEGQTVFYTCTRCSYKETENS